MKGAGAAARTGAPAAGRSPARRTRPADRLHVDHGRGSKRRFDHRPVPGAPARGGRGPAARATSTHSGTAVDVARADADRLPVDHRPVLVRTGAADAGRLLARCRRGGRGTGADRRTGRNLRRIAAGQAIHWGRVVPAYPRNPGQALPARTAGYRRSRSSACSRRKAASSRRTASMLFMCSGFSRPNASPGRGHTPYRALYSIRAPDEHHMKPTAAKIRRPMMIAMRTA